MDEFLLLTKQAALCWLVPWVCGLVKRSPPPSPENKDKQGMFLKLFAWGWVLWLMAVWPWINHNTIETDLWREARPTWVWWVSGVTFGIGAVGLIVGGRNVSRAWSMRW